MEKLACRACGAALAADAIDRRLAIVSCGHCGAIFDLTRRRQEGPQSPAPPARKPRAPAALPAKFAVEEDPTRLVVRWRWFTPAAFFLLPFAIAWNGFLVFWYSMALGSDAPEGGLGLLVVVFPLAHVAVGVALAYGSIAMLVNRSELSVDAHELRVTHRPLPWWPAPRLPVNDVEQLYVKRRVSRTKNGSLIRYELRVVTRTHSGRLLLRGLDELEQALWLEQAIEERLRIRDRAVAGEFRGATAEV